MLSLDDGRVGEVWAEAVGQDERALLVPTRFLDKLQTDTREKSPSATVEGRRHDDDGDDDDDDNDDDDYDDDQKRVRQGLERGNGCL